MSNRKKARIKPVDQGKFDQIGVYMWEMPDGSFVADDNRNFLNIPSMMGDLSRMNALRDAARSLGITEGQPIFFAGHRRVTDEEYANQQQRMKDGLIPDEYDLPAIVEDINDQRRQ